MTPEKRARGTEPQGDRGLALARMQRELTGELVLSSLRAQEEMDALEQREWELLATADLRERLLGILGHDLRLPLSAIRMAGDRLWTRGDLTAQDRPVVAQLLKSARRMSTMITQILDFTRARLGGGTIVTLRPMDLGDLSQSVADEIALSCSASIECEVAGDVRGNWDADRLAEALSNILGNAVEHARGGASAAVHVQGDGADVVVEISNLGDPIDPEMFPFIFEPFRRAKQSEHSTAGNLGLGLYIAHEITRAHQGTLTAACCAGRTTFTLRLPRDPKTRTLA